MTTSTLEQIPSTTASETDSADSVFDTPPAPLLKDVVAAIRLDARRDSLRYALRSNVGHDGE